MEAQDLIDGGVKPGTSTSDRGELAAAKRRIRELETELALVTQAAKLFEEGAPKSHLPGHRPGWPARACSAKRCWRILGVAASGFFMWRRRAPSPRQLRLAWLTDLVRAIHAEARDLRVAAGQRRAGLWPRRHRQPQDGPQDHALAWSARAPRRAQALPQQGEHRGHRCRPGRAPLRPAGPDQLWVTDITEHPTREGKLYCCVVLEVFSRRVVGWSIDSHQATPLVTNALAMAISNRQPGPEQTVIH